MKQTTLQISGMRCAACAARIEKSLNQMPGVNKAEVNFALGKVSLSLNPGTQLNDIIKSIEKLGYQVIQNKDSSTLQQQELKKQKIKLAVSFILSFPLLWAMASHFTFTAWIYLPHFLMNPWIQFALATPVQFIIGREFYVGSYRSLLNKSANMDVLIALGTSAAYFYSLFLTLQWTLRPETPLPGLYYETSAILITLILLGRFFETLAKGRTSEAIQKLMRLQPKRASVIRNDQEISILIEEVIVGDIVLIRPGDKIPVDGEVIEGISSVNESMLTGESLPMEKTIGSSIAAGTLNGNGSIKIKASRIGKDTLLAQIIKAVEDAQNSKAPIQRIADVISGIFVPIVVVLAVITFLIWWIWASPGHFAGALEKAIAVLVIACPCALGLATPTSIMSGTGRAAEFGILFKNGEALELMHKIKTIILDKTGTVTQGKPELTHIFAENIAENDFLSLVGAAEKNSEHPLAQAILTAVMAKGIVLIDPSSFEAIPGYGIRAVVKSNKILIGTEKLMRENNISLPEISEKIFKLENEGNTTLLVAINQQYAGILAVADTIKKDSPEAIKKLKKMGMELMMITGDNQRTAKAIANQVGIDEVMAGVLPAAKAERIKQIQAQGKKVMMVGDGINDAPALASADIGVAMGSGSDIAIESADVTLVHGNLSSLAVAIHMSRKTMANIKQNLFWALGYNVLGIPIAAAGFLAPWIAGAAMAFSSLSVVLNALRLQYVKSKL